MAKKSVKVQRVQSVATAISTAKQEKTMKFSTQGVLKALKECESVRVEQTRYGNEYNILKPSEEFWSYWRADKEKCKALGIVVFPAGHGEYLIRDFTQFEYDCSKKASKARSVENLAKAREIKAEKVAVAKAATPQIDPELAEALKTLAKFGIKLQ